jgi:predicted dehydrogenase
MRSEGNETMIRIGLIGAGPNGADHARYYSRSPRSELVAIADPDQNRAKALATELGTMALADYREMLDQVDAIVISSPNFLHREHAVECAEAGKHIYCEKPMGISLDEAHQINEAVQKAGVKSVVGFTTRFTPPFQRMEQVLKDEQLGQLISICSRRLVYSNPAHMVGWRHDHNLSGGLLLELIFMNLTGWCQ